MYFTPWVPVNEIRRKELLLFEFSTKLRLMRIGSLGFADVFFFFIAFSKKLHKNYEGWA